MAGKPLIIVLGMHRSGTSAMAGVLSSLGVQFGRNLIAPLKGVNEKGFFESKEVVKINEALLGRFGLKWYSTCGCDPDWTHIQDAGRFRDKMVSILEDEFRHFDLPGIKDPRLCRLMPLWREMISHAGYEPRYVFIIRSPMEVAMSLARRDNLDICVSLTLWLRYNLEALRTIGYAPHAIVHYPDLLTDWKKEAGHIARRLDIAWAPEAERYEDWIGQFVDSRMRHFSFPGGEEVSGEVFEQVKYVYGVLASKRHDQLDAVRELARVERTLNTSSVGELLMNRIEVWEAFHALYEARDIELREQYERIAMLNSKLSELGSMHTRALEVIAERDSQLGQVNENLSRLGEEHGRALAVIRERDSQLDKMRASLIGRLAMRYLARSK